jgi:hypothetical protein
MDLATETHRLRLDLLAVEISKSFTAAVIPHVLIKGPSTSLWLYDPPRPYNDVDVLVPATRVVEAAAVLARAGIADGDLGGTGLEASHSHTLHSAEGYEVDLHTSLPTVPAREDDAVWDTLSSHLVPLDLGVGTVPSLDEPARCLAIALHAVSGANRLEQRVGDLQRAEAQASSAIWAQARELAIAIGAADLFDAGRRRTHENPSTAGMSPRAYLEFTNASPEAMSLDRLMSTPRRGLPKALWRELWPTKAFLREHYPTLTERPWGALRTRMARALDLSKRIPDIFREVRQGNTQRRTTRDQG